MSRSAAPAPESTPPDQRSREDDALMIRLQEMDRRAFDELVERYQGSLFGFFYANTRDRQLAEDLTQDTLLKVFDQAWDYVPSGRFRGWLFRIARNLMIDAVRRHSRDALIKALPAAEGEDDPLATVVGDLVGPADEANQHELSAIVDRLLSELPEEQRLTFSLHHFSELGLPEISRILDTNLSTSKSRLRLAREKLQSRMADYGITGTSFGMEHE